MPYICLTEMSTVMSHLRVHPVKSTSLSLLRFVKKLNHLTVRYKINLNYSNNPTFLSASDPHSAITGSVKFVEVPKKLKNTADYSFTDIEPPADQSVYISKINLYDEDRNLIAVAKLAKPIRKTKDREYTFKLKLDI